MEVELTADQKAFARRRSKTAVSKTNRTQYGKLSLSGKSGSVNEPSFH
jgi:hypothetical protein